MIISRLLISFWFIIITVLLCFFQNAGTVTLFVFSTLLLVLSSLAVSYASRKCNIIISAPKRISKGDISHITIKVRNNSRFDLPEMVIDYTEYNRLFDHSNARTVRVAVPAGKATLMDIPYSASEIGLTEVSISKAFCFDYFRIKKCNVKANTFAAFLIMPVLFDTIILFHEKNEDPHISTNSYNKISIASQGDPFDVREYIPGDSIKNIHWKLSEKVDKTLIRENAVILDPGIIIILDMNIQSRSQESTAESLISTAASISNAFTDMGFEHDIIIAGFTGSPAGHHISNTQDTLTVLADALSSPIKNTSTYNVQAMSAHALDGYTDIILITSNSETISILQESMISFKCIYNISGTSIDDCDLYYPDMITFTNDHYTDELHNLEL